MPGNYEIVQAQLPLVFGLGGHNLIVVKDPSGRVIQEFDGLATSADGTIKAVGYLPSDKLKVYSFDSPTYYTPDQNQYVVYSTNSFTDISERINAMTSAAAAMNAGDLSYPILGLGKNSNSVSSTLIAATGSTEFSVPNSAYIMPGVGDLLLPAATLDTIRTNNFINSPFGNNADTGTQFDNSWPSPNYGDIFGSFVS